MKYAQAISSRILLIRGYRVLIDADLADLYEVPTKRLNEQARRNASRFPADFRFRLNATERDEVVANCDHLQRLKYSKSPPYAFTEHGALMAASVLNSQRAIDVGIYVVRAFVQQRDMLMASKELAAKLLELERRLTDHDGAIAGIIAAIRELTAPQPARRTSIGFVPSRGD